MPLPLPLPLPAPGRQRACALIAAALALSCGKHHSSAPPPEDAAPPPPPPRLARAAAHLPPPAPAPTQGIGRGGSPTYPAPVALALGAGVAALDPPMRLQRAWPVPGRPLAVASGSTTLGPTIELIDVDRGVIRWRDTTCAAAVAHTTADRIVCGSAQGMAGMNVDDGAVLWRSPRILRAANQRWLMAIEPDDPLRGAVVDVQTGEVALEIAAAKGDTLDDVHEICAVEDGFDLFAWTEGGVMRRMHVPRTRAGYSETRRLWVRRLRMPPSKVDLCDPVMLVEVPIPGSEQRVLSAIARKTGLDLAPALNQLGWWPARSGDGIETATDDGIQVRGRNLEVKGQVASGRIGGRLVASWADTRLIRSVTGTLLLLDGQGVRAWLAAPAWVERAVLTGARIFGGSWLSPPFTNADHGSLWQLPAGRAQVVDLPLAAPAPAPVPEPPPQHLPAPPGNPSQPISLAEAGTYAVGDIVLAGERLYLVTLERRPGPTYGGGVAVFDLAARRWLWHRDDVCGHNATPLIAVADGIVVCAGRQLYPGHGLIHGMAADTGADAWTLELETVDWLSAAGGAVVASLGPRAAVIDARSGELLWEVDADNGHVPRVVPVAFDAGGHRQTRVIAVERGGPADRPGSGQLVARDPAARGAVAWTVAVRGYARRLERTRDGVALTLASGELIALAAADGSAATAGAWSPDWMVIDGGDLLLDSPAASEGVTLLRGFRLDGAEQLRTAIAITPPLEIGNLRGPGADLPLVSMRGTTPRVLVVEPDHGKLESVWALPPDVVRSGVFSAVAGGKRLVGVIADKPASVYLFP